MPDELRMDSQSTEPLAEEPQQYGAPRKKPGILLKKIPKGDEGAAVEAKIAKHAIKLWEVTNPIVDKHLAQWKVNIARRNGITNAKLVRRGGRDLDRHWTAYLPKNASPDSTPAVNKAADLCRRMTAMMFADPPISEAIPESGDDEDIDAAIFAERVLADLQGPENLNSIQKARRAFNKSHNTGSAYERFYVDPRGAGQVPIEVLAHPRAQHIAEALTDLDALQMGVQRQADPSMLVTTYLRPDGSLTKKKQEAATRWASGIKSEVLDGRYVRLLPHTCNDIEDAHGCQVACFRTWGEVKRMFPEVAKLPKSRIQSLFAYRPMEADDLMPHDEADETEDNIRDERLVFVLTTYYTQCEEYEKGLYLITLADTTVAHRDVWVGPETGDPLMLPLSQTYSFDEGREGYWKVALMEILGPGNEARGAQIANLLDHLEWLNSRKTFLPSNSTLDPDELTTQDKKVMYFNPGGQPVFEDIPRYPQDGIQMFQIASQEMDDASMLQETARGVQSSNVESGRHAFAIISQVHAGLSEPRQGIENAWIRGSRIVLQLASEYFDEAREARWEGEDGGYRKQSYTKADLDSGIDFKLKPGTLSMLAPAAKAQLAEHYATLGPDVMSPQELRDILSSNVGGTLGLQDNPFRMRIKSQLARWKEGPPEGWQPPQAPVDPMTGQPQLDPMTGQPAPPPPDPTLASIWQSTPADTLPAIAQMRMDEISKTMSGSVYFRHPPQWRQALDMEFQKMQMVMQQMQMAQQQAQQGGGKEGPPAPKPGGQLTQDLKEDAMRQGAPPDMIQ